MRMLSNLLILCILVSPGIATAQSQSSRFDHYATGPHNYDVPERNREVSISLMEQRRRDNLAADNPFFPNPEDGGTIAVGNWQQIFLTVGDGSTGQIHNSSPQLDLGTQTATSNVNSQNSAGNQTGRNGSDLNCESCETKMPQSWKWSK